MQDDKRPPSEADAKPDEATPGGETPGALVTPAVVVEAEPGHGEASPPPDEAPEEAQSPT